MIVYGELIGDKKSNNAVNLRAVSWLE